MNRDSIERVNQSQRNIKEEEVRARPKGGWFVGGNKCRSRALKNIKKGGVSNQKKGGLGGCWGDMTQYRKCVVRRGLEVNGRVWDRLGGCKHTFKRLGRGKGGGSNTGMNP